MTFTRRSLPLLVLAIALVGGLALCAAWAADALARKALQPEAVIPLYLAVRRVLVMVRIGDHPAAPVVFDTGTNDNILDTAYAEQFDLSRIGPSTSIDGSTGLGARLPDQAGRRSAGWDADCRRAGQFLDYRNTDEVGIFGPNSFPGKLVRWI